jgi:hypothetical protein
MTTTVDVTVTYPPPVDGDGALRIGTDASRPAALTARLHRPGVVRDALLAVGDVLASDLRHRGRDRADYLAYLIAKGKGVSKQVWDAQKEFLRLRYSEAAREEEPLDPVLTVAGGALRLEVMSKDESTYAQLTLRPEAFADAAATPGTTYVDLSAAALRAAGRLRAYRATRLELAPGGGEPRTRRVPLRWLRAFGQVQAATLLPAERFTLAPIDLYNLLLTLRLRKAKKPPRALRYELVPGEPPRIVLEPWDLVLTGNGEPYRGARPVVIRTWGRNRLLGLARILPHARSLRVELLGPGLPACYTAELGDATLTLALSGWTEGGWAGIATFDLLAAPPAGPLAGQIAEVLARGPATLDGLAAGLGRPPGEVKGALIGELAELRVGHDLATGELFARRLIEAPLPAGALRYRDAREEHAHRLLAEPGQVELVKVHDLGSEGQTIEGVVDDKKAHRRFHPSFTLDAEGRTASASCTCPAFRRAGIKEGPCEHMIAVRVLHAREQARLAEARASDEGRKLIRAETRTLLRRTAAGTETYRLSLDDRQVVARFGRGEPLRMQRLLFASADQARASYFERLAELEGKGFLDAG